MRGTFRIMGLGASEFWVLTEYFLSAAVSLIAYVFTVNPIRTNGFDSNMRTYGDVIRMVVNYWKDRLRSNYDRDELADLNSLGKEKRLNQ